MSLRSFFIYVFFIFQLLYLLDCNAQSEIEIKPEEKKKCKISLGLNYNIQLSYIDFSPIVNFKLCKFAELGAGVNYVYYYRKTSKSGESAYGGNIYGRYYPIRRAFIQAEYLYSNVPYKNLRIYESQRVNITNFLGGVGYRQPVTDHLYSYFSLLYDFTNTENSVYINKIIFRLGVTF